MHFLLDACEAELPDSGFVTNGADVVEYTWEPNPWGILVTHASAVVWNGKGFIFLGPSGTGKSTVCSILSGLTDRVADDRIYLIPSAIGWHIASADEYSIAEDLSEADVIRLRTIPLSGIFRLRRAAKPQIVPVEPLQTCKDLFYSYYELPPNGWCPVSSTGAVFSQLASVARSIPGYVFCFNLSSIALRVFDEMLWRSFGRCGSPDLS